MSASSSTARSSSSASARKSRLTALVIFVHDVYAPGLHIAFAAAWFLALDAGFSRVHGVLWRPTLSLFVGIATFFLILFYLRVVDEWKDYDYDCVFNPDRPLVRGTVLFADLYLFLAVTAAVVIGMQLSFPGFTGRSSIPLATAAADMAYALLLVTLERRSRAVRENMLMNLVVTYPVNVALSIYAYAAFAARTGTSPSSAGVLLIVSFALAFLHYEFGRKIAWPCQARPGKRLYSAALGTRLALCVALVLALVSIVTAAFLFRPGTLLSMPLVAAAATSVVGAVRFLRAGSIAPFAMVFLVLYYASVFVIAAFPST
jgi:hypothetical protein